jgi:ABC-type nitrate/sulfonate/bicarbonate transport system substrate-binding protein
MEQGQIDAAVMLDPAVTVLQGSHPDLRILSDTRTQKDTIDVFGGEYPGGALYSTTAWVAAHEKDVQALTIAIVNTLTWIHAHSPEEIMEKMPPEIVGKNKELYLISRRSGTRFRCIRRAARWTRRALMPCSRCSARVRPKLRKPISTSPRPTPTNMSTRPGRRRGRMRNKAG